MLRQFPFLSRFYSKLVYELLPGAVVSAVGGIVLHQYYKAPPVTVSVAPAEAEIVQAMREQTRMIAALKNSEMQPQAVTPLAHDPAQSGLAGPAAVVARAGKPADAKSARLEKPEKRVTAKPPRQAPAGPPLQLTQMTTIAAPVQPAPPPPAAAPIQQHADNTVMAKLRDVTETVQQIPVRVRSAVTWSLDDFPPRPPAPIPGRNFLSVSM